MATEALTKAKVRAECRARGISQQEDLAGELGVELKQLDAAIRRDLLLKGDNEAYRKAKEASGGFEHGFLNYDKVRELSQDVRHRMAEYVRTAILQMYELDSAVFSRLTSDPFNKPLGHWPIVKYLRGKLIGSGRELAAPGNAYPFVKWGYEIKNAKWEGGKFNIEITENLTMDLAEGVVFQPQSIFRGLGGWLTRLGRDALGRCSTTFIIDEYCR